MMTALPRVKTKFPRTEALMVAEELCDQLKDVCERLIVAGSLRRGAQEVGDVEILFIPKFVPEPRIDMFSDPVPINAAQSLIVQMANGGVIEPRKNKEGHIAGWGPKNKLAVHVASGIPVDFFSVLLQRCSCGKVSNESNFKISKQDSTQEALRSVRQLLREQKCESLQQDVQCQTSVEGGKAKEGEELPRAAMRSLRKDVQEKLLEGTEGVFSSLHGHAPGTPNIGKTLPEQKVSGDERISRLQRVYTDLRPKEILGTDSHPKNQTCGHVLRSGTPSDNGKTSGAEIVIGRAGSSSERNQRRQSIGEFGNRDEKSSYGESSLPALPKGISNQITCPRCLGTGWCFGSWWVSLVIRTGPKEFNLKLTTGAQRQGKTLNAYGSGVTDKYGIVTPATSEKHVCQLCNVPYAEPRERR